LGLCIHKSLCWQNLWMFFVAPLAGGVLAAVVFLAVNEADDKEPETIPEHPGSRTADREQR